MVTQMIKYQRMTIACLRDSIHCTMPACTHVYIVRTRAYFEAIQVTGRTKKKKEKNKERKKEKIVETRKRKKSKE